MDKLPAEVPLPKSYTFHTVFSCPVSKDIASEDNPPVILPCGHVISKRSLEDLDAILSRQKYATCEVQF
jgi:hypothetical protein